MLHKSMPVYLTRWLGQPKSLRQAFILLMFLTSSDKLKMTYYEQQQFTLPVGSREGLEFSVHLKSAAD